MNINYSWDVGLQRYLIRNLIHQSLVCYVYQMLIAAAALQQSLQHPVLLCFAQCGSYLSSRQPLEEKQLLILMH